MFSCMTTVDTSSESGDNTAVTQLSLIYTATVLPQPRVRNHLT